MPPRIRCIKLRIAFLFADLPIFCPFTQIVGITSRCRHTNYQSGSIIKKASRLLRKVPWLKWKYESSHMVRKQLFFCCDKFPKITIAYVTRYSCWFSSINDTKDTQSLSFIYVYICCTKNNKRNEKCSEYEKSLFTVFQNIPLHLLITYAFGWTIFQNY